LEDISIQSWKRSFFNTGLQFQMSLAAICEKNSMDFELKKICVEELS